MKGIKRKTELKFALYLKFVELSNEKPFNLSQIPSHLLFFQPLPYIPIRTYFIRYTYITRDGRFNRDNHY